VTPLYRHSPHQRENLAANLGCDNRCDLVVTLDKSTRPPTGKLLSKLVPPMLNLSHPKIELPISSERLSAIKQAGDLTSDSRPHAGLSEPRLLLLRQCSCGQPRKDGVSGFGRMNPVPEQVFVRHLALKWRSVGHDARLVHNIEAERRRIVTDVLKLLKYVELCDVDPWQQAQLSKHEIEIVIEALRDVRSQRG